MPNTVPNNPADIATFGVSNTANVSLSASVTVDSIVFSPGASAYTIASTSASNIVLAGAGIVNNSGVTQNFTTLTGINYTFAMSFTGSARAGVMTVFTNSGNGNQSGTSEEFRDTSSADHATFINEGPISQNNRAAGSINFFDSSTAANSTILNNGGGTFFFANSTADHAAITCSGGTVAQPAGGTVGLESGSGGNAVFTLNGTDARGATGGSFFMLYAATTATATLIANGGQVAGGLIRFDDGATGGNARIELFGNGKFDISVINNPVPVTTGSLEGDGLVFLGIKNLSVGGNSLSTTFSGVISDGGEEGGVGGSLTKVGSGSLELSGVNTYTGGTTVSAGTLIVSNTIGSATGTGAVNVNTGTLGGGGIIFGAVTVNSGAFLAPAHGTKTQSTLTIQSALTCNSGSTYTYTFKAKGKQAKTDKVIANGVTINSGANVTIQGTTKGSLKAGTAYTLISNTSANAISGTFSNLADGAIVNVNGNNLQASYEGGDGNDLALTVVP